MTILKKKFGRKNWRKDKEKNVDELQNHIKNIEREENYKKLKDNVQKRYLEGRIAVNKNLLNKIILKIKIILIIK